MAKYLVIVESPTKARTIKRFLPREFVVEASLGHVRDLPQTASEIPAKFKKEKWSRMGVDVENEFQPLYVVPKDKKKVIKDLKEKLKDAEELYLATDEDREGESISWHLIQLLDPKVPVKRMVFHEITKSAIEKALKDCREVDTRLVQAQETRRILDRLVGYTISPLIWKKIAFGLSAGRVQSAGLRLLVQRERERLNFKKAAYWDLQADVEKDEQTFQAKLLSVGGKRIATGKDFDETTGKPLAKKDVLVLDEKQANDILGRVDRATWKVISTEEKPSTSRPVPPFITSTLQQDSNRRLGLSARDTMRVAQGLYEQGLITYMRTDSPALSQEAIAGARTQVEKLYGKEFLSEEPRQFTSKNKGAQEAHEAIRPAGESFKHPAETGLTGKELKVYDLIWKRAMASQMADAKKLSVSVRLEADDTVFSATGMKIVFPGFLKVYSEGTAEDAIAQREVLLPNLAEGDTVKATKVEPLAHETKPPPRFTEASIVQRLEKEGIGRPSTYASIIATILARDYARKVGNALVPTFTGMAVVQLLEKHFEDLVDFSFTSAMEDQLDQIASGDRDWLPYLKEFYLGQKGLLTQVEQKEKKIDPDTSRTIKLATVNIEGVDIRVGRFGPYIVKATDQKGEPIRASIPEDIAPADLSVDMLEEIIESSEKGPQPIGEDPKSGKKVYCLLGRYGPYVQLGEVVEGEDKPRRASVPKGTDYRSLELEVALKLLSLPRELGNDPESGKAILANNGRFGPYVVRDGDFRSLKKDDDVYTIDLKRALEILAEEKRGRGGAKQVKNLGAHPDTGKLLGVYDGKYGLYLKHGSTNVSLPKDAKAEDVTLEQAVELMADKISKRKTAKTTKKKAAKPKTAKKKKKKTKKAKANGKAKKAAKATKSKASAAPEESEADAG